MPAPVFLLSHIGFNGNNEPIVDIEIGGGISRHPLLGETFHWTIDQSVRYCTGWFDIARHQAYACPTHEVVDDRYEQCRACRNKTGFNPAFYHAKEVSPQQQMINQRPHFLYLAYFTPTIIKVGISQEARGIRRLLEQGARVAIKLETFPSAEVARQYEARIAQLDGIVEHVLVNQKISSLKESFDEMSATALLYHVVEGVSSQLSINFANSQVIKTAQYYHETQPSLGTATVMKGSPYFTGTIKAVIGSLVVTEYHGRLLIYNLKSFVGYQVASRDTLIELDLPNEQMALF